LFEPLWQNGDTLRTRPSERRRPRLGCALPAQAGAPQPNLLEAAGWPPAIPGDPGETRSRFVLSRMISTTPLAGVAISGFRPSMASIAVGFGLLALMLSQISGSGRDQTNQAAASLFAQHQVDSREHPLDSCSTAGVHTGMFLGGVIKGLSYPIGYGLGWVAMAANWGATTSN
jgi:hypothetical protein